MSTTICEKCGSLVKRYLGKRDLPGEMPVALSFETRT
jgi:hypothetical protein